MSKVISYEFRMNNSTQHTVSHLDAGKLVGDLVYASYRAQRDTSPEVTPQRWGRLECFEEYTDLEARYQRELAARAEANECIAGIGTDATGENGRQCRKPVVGDDNLCVEHEEGTC